MKLLVAVLVLSCFAWTQATPARPKPPVLNPPTTGAPPSAEKPAPAAEKNVATTDAVITIEGLCQGKVPANPPAGCKTMITRAEFEKLADALNPKMPAATKRQLAQAYSQLLVMSDLAQQRGLQNEPDTKQMIHFAEMQALTQRLLRSIQEDAAKVPDAEAKAYYDEHPQRFEQATLLRIFIPKTPPGGEKAPDEKALKAEAGKIRALAAAPGADFEKLQKQAYDDLGLKTPPPPVSAGSMRRENLPPEQAKVFDLPLGQVSEALDEPGGFYIYKVENKKKLTLADAQPEITRALEGERMQKAMEQITKRIKPEFNEGYFGGMPAEGPPRGMPRPGPRPPAPPPPKPESK
ncbi:MAG: peptidyl-prolyl cis-trans isomerase [Terriglobales bacterium]